MSFQFHTGRRLVELCGRKAKNLPELLGHLREVSPSSVFYHTHERYLRHHFSRPHFYNDFAEWCSRTLQEEATSEKLAAIDMLAYTSLNKMREAMVKAIEESVEASNGSVRVCPPGDEFHFCQVRSFIMPTGVVAEDLEQFVEALRHITNSSTFFHFFEARLRLERTSNDFSAWLTDLGERRLADDIDRIDPYNMTLDELRQHIYVLCRRRLSEKRQ